MITATDLGISFKLKRKRIGTQDWLARIGRNHHEKFWALDSINFSVEQGETLGVIGANGSGKSTLLRVLAGIYKPHRGSLVIDGKVATLLTTTAGFQSDLTGLENIYMNGILTGLKKERINEIVDDVVKFSGLGDFVTQPVKTYSSGMYARLGFSIAIHADGDVLLVDEVLGAGDAAFSEKARSAIAELLSKGKTVVLVSHSVEAVKKFADRVMWLDYGKIKMLADPETAISAYLESQRQKEVMRF